MAGKIHLKKLKKQKKIITLFFLFFAGIFISGCSINLDVDEVSDEKSHDEDLVEIRFNTAGGDFLEPLYVERGGRAPKSGSFPTPAREGFAFYGWTSEAPRPPYPNNPSTISHIESVEDDTTVFASWRELTDEVTLNLIIEYDTSDEVYSKISYPPGSRYPQTGELPTPELDDYKFLGWFDGRVGFGDKITHVDGLFRDVNLFAHIIPHVDYSVTFDSRGGSSVDSIIAQEGDRVPNVGILPQPLKDGYKFLGWSTSLNSPNNTIDAIGQINRDTHLYANWEKASNLNTLSFNSMGGIELGNIYFEDNQRVPYFFGDLPSGLRRGYEFRGWFTQKNGTGNRMFYIDNLDSSIILYAHWQINEYNVTFDSQGGSVVSSTIHEYGSRAPLEGDFPHPEKNGYYFMGWYNNKDGEGRKIDRIKSIDGNQKLYAYWIKHSSTSNAIQERYLRNIEALGEFKNEFRNRFSNEGYINSQSYADVFEYGNYDSSYNGCGWIATYNLLRRLQIMGLYEEKIFIPEIIRDYEYNGSIASGKLGTYPWAIRNYLEGFDNFEVNVSYSKNDFEDLIKNSDASIYGYLGSKWGHYMTAFYNEGDFNILNPSETGSSFDELVEKKFYIDIVRILITIEVK